MSEGGLCYMEATKLSLNIGSIKLRGLEGQRRIGDCIICGNICHNNCNS